jgi:divalent metal cation (Fe/Co/Zn/Cd) transporter
MNPNRVDTIVDFTYGVLIFVAIALILTVGTAVGVAFGLGVLVAYTIHVGWKMARFDPQWMTEEATKTLTEEVDEAMARIEDVNDRVDRRPREDEVEETVNEEVDERVEDTVSEEVDERVEETVAEEVSERVEETVSKEVEEKTGEQTDEGKQNDGESRDE